jgi:hypothetical protein
MASPSDILTYGLGGWGSPSDIVTLGFGSGVAVEYSSNGNLYYDIGSNLSIMLGTFALSNWNTAGRPTSPRNYQVGFNTTTSKIELWTGSAWIGVTLA